MKKAQMDNILPSRTVMFVGDFFTLMTTIVLDETIRNEGEADNDFAVRLASVLMTQIYGFDVASVANSIGVVDEEGLEV
jgi:hypothetical protein